MRLSHFLIASLLFVGMLLTSCGTFSEEVWINADGTGRYKLDYDASESLAMLEMMSQMGGDEEQEADSENPEEVMKDALTQEKFDTSFNLMSTMPDSVRQIVSSKHNIRQAYVDQGRTISDAGIDSIQQAVELMGKLDFAMQMDKEAGVFGFGATINFDKPSDVSNTFGGMATLKSMDANESSDASGMADKMTNRTTFELKGNTIIVRQAPVANMDELLNATGKDVEGMDAEQMEGLLEMMGLSKYEVKVHVPGLVKSVKGADFVQENDNTVVLSIDYLEAMRGGELLEAEISFKPKRKFRRTVPK